MHKKIDLDNLSQEELLNEWSIREEELRIQNEQLIESSEQLAEAANRFERIFLCFPLPVVLLDSRGFVKDTNVAAQDTFQMLVQMRRFLFSRILTASSKEAFADVFARRGETPTTTRVIETIAPAGQFTATFIDMGHGDDADFAVVLQPMFSEI